MTTVILIAGVLFLVACALAIWLPEWRLPALLLALLAMPGNVDNVLPQMMLDPNPIANNAAPVASAIDVLVLLAVFLSVREGRWTMLTPIARRLVLGGLTVWGMVTISALVALGAGVEPAAVIRGSITFLRVPALLFLALVLWSEAGFARNLAIAATLGIGSLIANGIYTSALAEATRFTASTFGRNGFQLALAVSGVLAAGLTISYAARSRWGPSALAALAVSVALFAAIATGTRASLLALVPATVFALIINRRWFSRRGAVGLAAAIVLVLVVGTAAVVITPEGGRATSVLTDPGETVHIVTHPGDQPSYSPVTTRTHFWRLAGRMVAEHPVAGVGPFQWNIQRYQLEPTADQIVVDTHNTYIQIAAEYGIPVLAAYLLLLGTIVGGVLLTAWRRNAVSSHSWTATCLAATAVVFPITELTNSHFFNVRLGGVEWLLLGSAFAVSYLATAGPEGEPAHAG